MRKKKIIIKAIIFGIGLFVYVELIYFVYTSLIKPLLPFGGSLLFGKEWLGSMSAAKFEAQLVDWLCHPLSNVLKILFRDMAANIVLLTIVNAAGWLSLSMLVFYFKNKSPKVFAFVSTQVIRILLFLVILILVKFLITYLLLN